MKEYDEAKRELDRVYREEKKKLAEKVRPIFFKQFADFFEKYPEVKEIKFDISSQIYNDEDYYHGVENIMVELQDEHMTEAAEEHFETYGWEDSAYSMQHNSDVFAETMESESRVVEVADAITKIGYVVHRTDIDFLENVFDTDKSITIDKRGFTVE